MPAISAAAKRPARDTWKGRHKIRRVAEESLRQPVREHLDDLASSDLGVLRAEEDLQPRPPLVVGGALGVEPEHLRAAPTRAALWGSAPKYEGSSGRTASP